MAYPLIEPTLPWESFISLHEIEHKEPSEDIYRGWDRGELGFAKKHYGYSDARDRVWSIVEGNCNCLSLVTGEQYLSTILHFMVSRETWKSMGYEKGDEIILYSCPDCVKEMEEDEVQEGIH